MGTLFVHFPLKLHLSFSVMNNSNNAFSHQLMMIFGSWSVALLVVHSLYIFQWHPIAASLLCMVHEPSLKLPPRWAQFQKNTSRHWTAMWQSSLKRFVWGSICGEYKRECSSFICYETSPHQFQHRNIWVGRTDRPGLKNKKKTETSIEHSLYRWLFPAPSVVNQRGNRGISDSSVSPTKTMRQFTHR